jgi:hypothetical protein
MKKITKILLFVMCLTAAFFVSVAIANGQEIDVKNSVSARNILSEIVRARVENNSFTLITPDI